MMLFNKLEIRCLELLFSEVIGEAEEFEVVWLC